MVVLHSKSSAGPASPLDPWEQPVEIAPLAAFGGPPLAVLTCHFNFAGHTRPVQNLRRFIRQIERDGVPVFGCEAVAPGSEAVMAGHPRWRVFEVSNHGVLWQKEALLNAAARLVPDEIPFLAAVDADVWFDNPRWAEESVAVLEEFPAMQPFEHCFWTDRHGGTQLIRESSAKAGLDTSWRGHPGFAWAFHRSFFDEVGFYPWAVLGSGDTSTCSGLLDTDLMPTIQRGIGLVNLSNGVYDEWRQRARAWIGESPCGWIRGGVWHEWHGDRRDRKYAQRTEIVAEAFDARRDVRLTDEGWLEWTRYAHPALMSRVATYFLERKEDG